MATADSRPRRGRKPRSLVGLKFGSLTVISFAGFQRTNPKWNVRCDCGTEKSVFANKLKTGRVKTCGCRWNKGNSKHPLYVTWTHMLDRCRNENADNYCYYGARGISVCIEWTCSFVAFRDYIESTLGPKPSRRYTLDRINTNGNYEPGNVRWATPSTQAGNTRRAVRITWNGETRCVSEWARLLRLPIEAVRSALKQRSLESIYADKLAREGVA